MKISTNSRYALRFLTRLADAEGRMTTMSIAQAEGISEKMLERIAAKLGREGFVRSSKGVGGGYELSRLPSEITVTQVLQTMETPYLPLHCIEEHEDCRMAGNCAYLCLWEQIDQSIRNVTDHITLADVVTDFRRVAGGAKNFCVPPVE